MFKILRTCIFVEKNIYIKCNIWRVAVRPSYVQDARFLKVKEKSDAPNSSAILSFNITLNMIQKRGQIINISVNKYLNFILRTILKDYLLDINTLKWVVYIKNYKSCWYF